jgi:hypothetical protein
MLGAKETTNTTPLRDGGKLADAARIGNMETVRKNIGNKDTNFRRGCLFLAFSYFLGIHLGGPYRSIQATVNPF